MLPGAGVLHASTRTPAALRPCPEAELRAAFAACVPFEAQGSVTEAEQRSAADEPGRRGVAVEVKEAAQQRGRG